jgi:hypothetical protein
MSRGDNDPWVYVRECREMFADGANVEEVRRHLLAEGLHEDTARSVIDWTIAASWGWPAVSVDDDPVAPISLLQAAGYFNSAIRLGDPSDPGYGLAVTTALRVFRRALDKLPEIPVTDLYLCALVAMETGVREGDQRLIDAGWRSLSEVEARVKAASR